MKAVIDIQTGAVVAACVDPHTQMSANELAGRQVVDVPAEFLDDKGHVRCALKLENGAFVEVPPPPSAPRTVPLY